MGGKEISDIGGEKMMADRLGGSILAHCSHLCSFTFQGLPQDLTSTLAECPRRLLAAQDGLTELGKATGHLH
jgi:hypothetical protein